MKYSALLLGSLLPLAGVSAQVASPTEVPPASAPVDIAPEAVERTEAAPVEAPVAPPAMLQTPLPAGTPVIVSLDAELSTQTSQLGDSFSVTVVNDVLHEGIVVIPKGTRGRGEITFLTKKGGFGKPGIIGIALRDMELGGRHVLLDGRFREEGGNNNAATAATMFAVGIVAGLVKGKSSVIPAGRELKGRTGEDIMAAAVPEPALPPDAVPADAAVDISNDTRNDTGIDAGKPDENIQPENAKPEE